MHEGTFFLSAACFTLQDPNHGLQMQNTHTHSGHKQHIIIIILDTHIRLAISLLVVLNAELYLYETPRHLQPVAANIHFNLFNLI